jgi:gamma-glutamyl phosphate reductase
VSGLDRVCADVRAAGRVLRRLPGAHRDAILAEMADALERRTGEILRENRQDVEAARRDRVAPALVDRRFLDEDRVADMAAAIRGVAALPDPVGAVDAAADLDMALKIAVNAKAQRPGVCNAAETLLVHRDVAPAFLPAAAARLRAEGVELRVDGTGLALLGAAAAGLAEATAADYDTEFLDLVMAVRVVDSLDQALEHIARHGSGHSEAIVTASLDAARRFQQEVDAAAVYVNASTRFTDGGEFGMGAEIGISTQKLHARGPIGLAELTTYTHLVTGRGHVR